MTYMVKLNTNGTSEIAEYSWDAAKEYIGGYIQVASSTFEVYTMLIDEEGKLKDLPVNHKATLVYFYNKESICDILCGDAVFVNIAGDDFVGMTKNEANNLKNALDRIIL